MQRIFEQRAFWMLAAIVAVVVGLSGDRIEVSPAVAQSALQPVGTGGLIAHFIDEAANNQSRVIVIDPLQRRMAVYDVEQGNGAIQLKSVRNLNPDLQVQEFNSGDPSPIDMQKLLDRNP